MTITNDPHGTTQQLPGNDRSSEVNEAISKDDIFFVLKNERRRLVLQYLADSEKVVKMRDITEQVAAWEHDTTLAALTSDDRQRVYIALYQSHLPTLDEVGLINYRQSRGIIKQTGRMEQILPYIEPNTTMYENDIVEKSVLTNNKANAEIRREPKTWGGYLAGVTVFNMILVGSVWAGLQPVASISGRELTATVMGIYAILTLGMILRR